MPAKSDLLDELAASPPLAEKLGAARTGAAAVAFEQVVESARPVLAALLARAAKGRVWIVCADVRAQEAMHNELLHWHPGALFFFLSFPKLAQCFGSGGGRRNSVSVVGG